MSLRGHSDVTQMSLREQLDGTQRALRDQLDGTQRALRDQLEGTQRALRGTSEGTHLLLIRLHRNAIPQQLAELLGTNLTTTVGVNEAKKHF